LMEVKHRELIAIFRPLWQVKNAVINADITKTGCRINWGKAESGAKNSACPKPCPTI